MRGDIDGIGRGRDPQQRRPRGEQARQVGGGDFGPFGGGDAGVGQSGRNPARNNFPLFD